MPVTVRVRCVGCGAKRDIKPGEVPAGEVPMCTKCYSPMVVVSSTSTS